MLYIIRWRLVLIRRERDGHRTGRREGEWDQLEGIQCIQSRFQILFEIKSNRGKYVKFSLIEIQRLFTYTNTPLGIVPEWQLSFDAIGVESGYTLPPAFEFCLCVEQPLSPLLTIGHRKLKDWTIHPPFEVSAAVKQICLNQQCLMLQSIFDIKNLKLVLKEISV